ncbi:hypothetical protein SRHO_G00055000 [Serrasalmus rhombeus]
MRKRTFRLSKNVLGKNPWVIERVVGGMSKRRGEVQGKGNDPQQSTYLAPSHTPCLNAPTIIPLSLPVLLTALQLAASRRCLQARSGVEQCEPPTEMHRYSPSSAGGIVSAPAGREGSQQVLHPEQTTQEARPVSVRDGDAESRAECELWHGESS